MYCSSCCKEIGEDLPITITYKGVPITFKELSKAVSMWSALDKDDRSNIPDIFKGTVFFVTDSGIEISIYDLAVISSSLDPYKPLPSY